MSTNEPAQKMSKGDSSQRAQFGQKPLGRRKPGSFGNLLHVEMGDRDPEVMATREAKPRPRKPLHAWKTGLDFIPKH